MLYTILPLSSLQNITIIQPRNERRKKKCILTHFQGWKLRQTEQNMGQWKHFEGLFSLSYSFCNRFCQQILPITAAFLHFIGKIITVQTTIWVLIFLAQVQPSAICFRSNNNLPGVHWESTHRYSNTRDSMTQIVLLLRSSFWPYLSDWEEVTRQFVLLWLPTAAVLKSPIGFSQTFLVSEWVFSPCCAACRWASPCASLCAVLPRGHIDGAKADSSAVKHRINRSHKHCSYLSKQTTRPIYKRTLL